MMLFGSCRTGSVYRAVCRVGGRLLDLQRAVTMVHGRMEEVPADLPGLLAFFGGLAPLIDAVQSTADVHESLVLDGKPDYGPPVPSPGKIICVGLNYPAGADDLRPVFPTLFLKAASTLAAHGDTVVLPAASGKVFCEGELALVIGKKARNIAPGTAWEYIAGLTVANDVGAEDLEARTSQWQTGKLPDTFLPMGPWMVPAAAFAPADSLEIQVFVNDNLILSGKTAEMFFSPAELVEYISGIATLHPGDLIVTGSPKQLNGAPAGRVYLRSGDSLRIDIGAIGSLENTVVSEEDIHD